MHSAPPPLTAGASSGLPGVAATEGGVATPTPRFLTASLALELGILVALSVLFPFLIHVLPVPDSARLGPRLLPIFYAPLLATLLGRIRSAIAVAALAPWLNWLVTGYPRPQTAWLTMLELLVFVVVLRAMLARIGTRWFLAVPAYLAAMAVGTAVVAIDPVLIGGRPAAAWLTQSVALGVPGIAILLLINWVVVRTYPGGGGGHGPITA